jgi:small subunit ribosomal protein S1
MTDLENQTIEFWNQLELEDSKRKNKNKSLQNLSAENQKLREMYESFLLQSPTERTIVKGTYVGIYSNQHCFNVAGFKDWVRVDNRHTENKYLKNTQIGDVVEIYLSKVDHNNYSIEGSIAELYETAAHESLKALEDDAIVMSFVKSINPAGYDLEIVHDGVTFAGFMPNTLAGINKLYDPESIVGKNLEVMIESYSKDEGTYIVSRRKYLKTLIPDAISKLNTGEVYSGNVTGTTPFGIFVEFNECLTGMIHKANVHPDWQEKLTEVRPGFEIEFYVKEIIKDKIILTQILRETLWDTIKNGQTLDGKIKDVKQFGILVSLDEETMGLIHTSEVEKIGKKFTPGQEVKIKVLSVDRQNRKIFLTVA